MKNKHTGFKVITAFFILFGILALFSSLWYIEVYGDTGFESILFTFYSDVGGVAGELIFSWIKFALLPAVILSAVIAFFVLFDWKNYKYKRKSGDSINALPYKKGLRRIIAAILCLSTFFTGAFIAGIPEYIEGMARETDIYQKDYVNPESVSIKFPESKRNLITIYLESMETTYFSKQLGGAEEYNLIPELYELAKDNTNFSTSGVVGGWEPVRNTNWTVGSIVAQTSGLPLMITPNGRGYTRGENFLSGAVTITDVLKNAGYQQAVMFGSEASFGGRDDYFNSHSIDEIYDYNSAVSDGIIPEGYHVWWGMEDAKLFKYAKEVLPKLSRKEKPFSFSMLTADTHHIGGYHCSLCEDEYEEDYENVIACSSKQVYEFVEWIKKQDFYENTTIVICGDHPSMDAGYFSRTIDKNYNRQVYNCIINSPIKAENTKNRQFCAMDMFPTTLAAIGCEIEGDRLGLGTNLYSKTPTLCESIGYKGFNAELSKRSADYKKEFVEQN
ncbi:MAG: LTA synthase family protein [Clostridia bacterium]|nr:LTA synthase family protein [Clostridia bacterium]